MMSTYFVMTQKGSSVIKAGIIVVKFDFDSST